VSFNTNYWNILYYYIFQYWTSFLKFKNRISAVSYSADSESAMYPTTLIGNQRCMIQRWLGISALSDNTDISFQRYVFTSSFLLWSNERCQIQRWFELSAVSDNTDSELALYPIALIRDQPCIWQRWFMNFYLWLRIFPRIRNRIRK
jgi:tellurite resistance-related uncharacterized protein